MSTTLRRRESTSRCTAPRWNNTVWQCQRSTNSGRVVPSVGARSGGRRRVRGRVGASVPWAGVVVTADGVGERLRLLPASCQAGASADVWCLEGWTRAIRGRLLEAVGFVLPCRRAAGGGSRTRSSLVRGCDTQNLVTVDSFRCRRVRGRVRRAATGRRLRVDTTSCSDEAQPQIPHLATGVSRPATAIWTSHPAKTDTITLTSQRSMPTPVSSWLRHDRPK